MNHVYRLTANRVGSEGAIVEFQEVAHSGGQITFYVTVADDGSIKYQVEITTSRPVPVVLIELYATRDGEPVEPVRIRGFGEAADPPPLECFPVFLASDSHGPLWASLSSMRRILAKWPLAVDLPVLRINGRTD